jgi:hypothetical protein
MRLFARLNRPILVVACVLMLYGVYRYTSEDQLPPLKDGDIIFQTTWVDQSLAIGLASGSVYIHAGIIMNTSGEPRVIEAAATVKETPLHEWIQKGVLRRFTIYRYKNLTSQQAENLLKAANRYYGRPYDHYFSFDNQAIYCSELIYLAYRGAGLPVTPPERVGDLYISNPFTKKLIEQRWQDYPSCKGKDLTFEQCYGIIMAQEIVTPAHLTGGSHFELIFTNYY